MHSLLYLLAVAGCLAGPPPPPGPQGPPGAIEKFDLLQSFSGGRLGAFNTVDWPDHHVNDEVQRYVHENAVQDPATGQITITAERRNDGKVYSARLESYKVWSTAQSGDIKTRGYVEVRALLPAKVEHANLKGAWPAIWMLGEGNGAGWPRHGEIDIVEAVNGVPRVVMSVHSTNHFGGAPQHPPNQPVDMRADFTKDPLIAGLEWNVQDSKGQIDLTWWMSWLDIDTQQWKKAHTTLSLFKEGNNDYYDFYNSLNGEGFSLLINLAEGGVFPQTQECLIDGAPQYVVVTSAKAYGF